MMTRSSSSSTGAATTAVTTTTTTTTMAVKKEKKRLLLSNACIGLSLFISTTLLILLLRNDASQEVVVIHHQLSEYYYDDEEEVVDVVSPRSHQQRQLNLNKLRGADASLFDPRTVDLKSDNLTDGVGVGVGGGGDGGDDAKQIDYEAYLSEWDDPKLSSTPEEAQQQQQQLASAGPLNAAAAVEPLRVCDRQAPIAPEYDVRIRNKYSRHECDVLRAPPDQTMMLLLHGVETFGRTGNNLIEFLHALQLGKDRGVLIGITWGSWALHLITQMWMAIPGDSDLEREEWSRFVESQFCIKILPDVETAHAEYKKVIDMHTRDLFVYRSQALNKKQTLDRYIEFQGNVLRTLFRSYNNGTGINLRRKPVRDMCSVLDAMFGNGRLFAKYSVVHSRYLEGEPGRRLLERISRTTGCDPLAALEMEPEYVKAILKPLGMLEHPIIFITDHQKPEILENLLADREIGPMIHLVPEEASWIGGDLTVATMSDVFVGNPASTFSGFIAKSRVALGYTENYLFRVKNVDGNWMDVCDERAIFDTRVMGAMC